MPSEMVLSVQKPEWVWFVVEEWRELDAEIRKVKRALEKISVLAEGSHHRRGLTYRDSTPDYSSGVSFCPKNDSAWQWRYGTSECVDIICFVFVD